MHLVGSMAPSTVFEGLAPDALAWLAERTELRAVPAGTVVVRQGSIGQELYVVDAGTCEVVSNVDESTEVVLGLLHPGHVFGELSLFDQVRRSASVRAACDSALRVVPKAVFVAFADQFVRDHQRLVLNLARAVSQRLRARAQALVDFTDPSATEDEASP